MTPRRIRLTLGLCVAAGCTPEPEPCLDPYLPTGPVAEDHCDCPEGFLYYCANADTCAGTIGLTTCEPRDSSVFYMPIYCDCPVAWNEHGAFYVTCDGATGTGE